MGDQNATAAPSGTFDTADGPLNIAANRQEQYETLCRLVDRADLITDPRFADREARKQHRAELNEQLNDALRRRSALEWERRLSAAGVPAARILTVAQAVAVDQVAGRGFVTEMGNLKVTGSGVLFDGEPLTPSAPPPVLGEHNDELPALLKRWRGASHGVR